MSVKTSSLVPAATAIALLAAVLPSTSHAAPPAIAATCAACHGSKGISSVQGTPSLAGQPDIFTQYQLVFMRDGGRDAGVMKAIVRTLTDDNIRDLGAYYAALPPPSALKSGGDVDAEKVLAIMTPRHCNSCHKEDFAGQGESARLAGQRPEYLAKALADFRAGIRRGRGMGAMIEVSVTLHDQDIKMIAAYLARQP